MLCGTLFFTNESAFQTFCKAKSLNEQSVALAENKKSIWFTINLESEDLEKKVFRQIEMHFGRNAVYSEHITAADVLYKSLMNAAAVCACAESCTGGLIAKEITEIPGSSAIFWGSLVVYANSAKSALLKIPQEIIEKYGAVSGQVVELMAGKLLQESGVEVTMAVSGIAGPGGGTLEKPVGTVWIAVGIAPEIIHSWRCNLSGTRKEVREKAATIAMISAARLLEIHKTGEGNGSLLEEEYNLDSFCDW